MHDFCLCVCERLLMLQMVAGYRQYILGCWLQTSWLCCCSGCVWQRFCLLLQLLYHCLALPLLCASLPLCCFLRCRRRTE